MKKRRREGAGIEPEQHRSDRAAPRGWATRGLAGTALLENSGGPSAGAGRIPGAVNPVGERGITANLVHPGSTDTETNPADAPEADAERGYIALGRYGRADDVAATVVHLAGEGGRYVTGASIAVDGGFAA